MRLSRNLEEQVLPIDLTPFIDIVFNLVIFFILAVDMSQKDLVALELPVADLGNPDKNPEKERLTVNVTRTGKFLVKAREYDLPALKLFLAARAGSRRDRKTGLSDVPILIRCDRAAEFRHVQLVLQACGEPAVRIWKVHLAVAQPSGGAGRGS
jgi:biopolymer transport protein ExbD